MQPESNATPDGKTPFRPEVKVSVIMPVYNRERYVAEAIESVLQQTFRDFELIVVDDGSTDRSADTVQAFKDPRIRWVRQAHAGISAAMNRGLALARGEYVARLDSDDLWFPDMLASQLALLAENGEAGAVYARGQGMDEDGRPTAEVWGKEQRIPGDSLKSILLEDFTCNITVVAGRQCFEAAGGYDTGLCANEDWDIWLRISRNTTFVFNDRILARFRRHSGSVTSGTSPLRERVLTERCRVLDKFYAVEDLPPGILALRSLAYRNLHVGTGLLRLAGRNYPQALKSFGEAVRLGPNPAATVLRILWFSFSGEILGRFGWGRRLNQWQSRVRGRRRRRRKR